VSKQLEEDSSRELILPLRSGLAWMAGTSPAKTALEAFNKERGVGVANRGDHSDFGSGRLAGLGRAGNLVEAAALHVIDIAVDRDVARRERMLADAQHVVLDALLLRLDRVPFDEAAGHAAAAVLRVRPVLAVEGGGRETVGEE